MELAKQDINMLKMISIVIPCYNCEKSINRAVESVLRQTYTNWELILVDNNSSDNTVSILKKFAESYPDQIHYCSEARAGAPYARNKGLGMAKGDWIQFLDADDEIYDDKLERQILLGKENKCEIVFGTYYYILVGTNERKLLLSPYLGNKWLGLIRSELGRTSANLWKRTKVIEVGGWNEKLSSSQEYDLLFRLFANGANVAYDHKPSCNVFAEQNSISRPKDLDAKIVIINNNIELRLKIREYLKQNNSWSLEFSKNFDAYVYRFLMKEKFKAPQHAKKLLEELALDISIKDSLIGNSKYYAKLILQFFGLKKWIMFG